MYAALHAHIPAVIDRQYGSLAKILAELVLGAEAIHADDLHAFVNAIEHCFGHGDLAHCSDKFGVLRMLIEVIGSPPSKIASGFDFCSNIAHDIAGVLEANDRSERSCRVLLEELQRVIEAVINPVDNAVRCTPEIDRILRKTITDPVGPEFMGPPSLGIAARRNTGGSCREQKNNCCSMIVVVRLSKTLDPHDHSGSNLETNREFNGPALILLRPSDSCPRPPRSNSRDKGIQLLRRHGPGELRWI